MFLKLIYIADMGRLSKFFTYTILFSIFVLFAWQPAFSSFLKWYITKQCQQALMADCHIERVSKEGNHWVCHKVMVAPTAGEKRAAFKLDIDQLALSFNFKPFRWQLEVVAIPKRLDLDIYSTNYQTIMKKFKASSLKPWIQVKPRIKMVEAKLHIHHANDRLTEYNWIANLDWVKYKSGKISLRGEGNTSLEVRLERLGGRLESQFQFVNYPAADIYAITRPGLFPHFSGKLEEGTLNGTWNSSIAKNGACYHTVDLIAEECRFRHPLRHLDVIAPVVKFTSIDEKNQVHCAFSKACSLSLHKEHGDPLRLIDAKGEAVLSQDGRLELDITGRLKENGLPIKLSGLGTFHDEYQELVQLNLDIGHSWRDPFKARFFGRNLGEECQCIEAEIRNFGVEEAKWITSFLGYDETTSPLKVEKGYLDGALLFFIEKNHVTEILVENLQARNCLIDVHPWNLSLSTQQLGGHLKMNMRAEDFFHSLNGELKIQEGSIGIIGLEEAQLTNIETRLVIKEGVFQRSTMQGHWSGLDAEAVIDGTSPEHLLHIRSEGDAAKLATIVPVVMEDKWKQMLPEEQVQLEAKLSSVAGHLVLEGLATLTNQEGPTQKGSFGFDIEKACDNPWASLEPCLASHAHATHRVMEVELPWMKRELHVAGFRVKNGWFSANSLPLEKYVAPFIKEDSSFSLKGEIDLFGTFDHRHFSAKYDAYHVIFETDNFVITVPKTVSKGNYKCLFETAFEKGYLPIKNGTYFEKNSGLLFTDVSTNAYLESKKISLEEVETFCEGIYFGGDIDVDLNPTQKEDYTVDIYASSIDGKVSQFKNILSHFSTPKQLQELPLEGKIRDSLGGLWLHFGFGENDYQFNAKMAGSCREGVIQFEAPYASLEDVQLDFVYDHADLSLEISQLQASLELGKAKRAKHYFLCGEKIQLNKLGQSSCFDFWLTDEKHDLVRLKGELQQQETELIQVKLDQKVSHFGQIYPKEFQFYFTGEGEVDSFKLKLQNSLDAFKQFIEVGSPLFSSTIAKKLQQKNAVTGLLNLQLNYQKDDNLFTFQLDGEQLTVGDQKFDKALFKGKKSQHKWSIDQCQLGPFSFAAELLSQPDALKVEFLGAQYKKNALIGLEGSYNYQQEYFQGNLNLLECSLAELKSHFGIDLPLEGHVRGKGKFTLAMEQGEKFPFIDTQIELNLKNGKLGQLQLDDVEKLSCFFTSENGLLIKDLDTHCRLNESPYPSFSFTVKQIQYQPTNHDITVDLSHFSVPFTALEPISRQFEELAPGFLKEDVRDFLVNLKQGEEAKGALSFEKNGPYSAIHLELAEGNYHFWGGQHHLSDISCDCDPCEFRLKAKYYGENKPFWMSLVSRSPTLNVGELQLSRSSGMINNPLTLEWTYLPETGFLVEKAAGNFSGLKVDLQRDYTKQTQKDSFALTGDVRINFSQAESLFSKEVSEALISQSFGNGYLLSGNWHVHMTETEDFPFRFYFNGDLVGQNFQMKNYMFDYLRAHVNATPSSFYLDHLEISDTSGTLKIPKLRTDEQVDGLWVISAPEISVENFRPSLLKEVNAVGMNMRKPLVVENFALHNLEGDLGDINSWKAEGNLRFSNISKSHTGNIIFAFPSEILTSLGLDLKVLNPVSGSVDLQMEEGKFFLKSFKDVYSEGKLSKFYLPNSSFRSFVDLDGNVRAQVRMKQYNIFFKFAELFTVAIQGDLTKPTYTLTKQSKLK